MRYTAIDRERTTVRARFVIGTHRAMGLSQATLDTQRQTTGSRCCWRGTSARRTRSLLVASWTSASCKWQSCFGFDSIRFPSQCGWRKMPKPHICTCLIAVASFSALDQVAKRRSRIATWHEKRDDTAFVGLKHPGYFCIVATSKTTPCAYCVVTHTDLAD